MNTDDIIDAIVTVVILALFSAITIANTIPLYRGELGGFNVQIDKTALPTKGEIIPAKRNFTNHDVILMLVVADDYFPEPRVVEINGTEIDIDTSFLQNRTTALIQAADAMLIDGKMPNSKKMTYELYVGPEDKIKGIMPKRKWVFNYE